MNVIYNLECNLCGLFEYMAVEMYPEMNLLHLNYSLHIKNANRMTVEKLVTFGPVLKGKALTQRRGCFCLLG